MADHRDRDEDAPEAGNGQGAPEPEFGSSEWLLQQLSGGRLSGDSKQDDDADAEPPTGPRRSNWVEPPASTTPLVVPSLLEPEVRAPEPEPEAPAPEQYQPEPAQHQPEPESGVVEPTTPSFDPQFANPEDTFEPGAPFVWNLTPGVGGDPLAEVPAPSDPVAPAVPPAEPPVAPTFAAPGFTESLRMPEPPSWEVLLTGAAADEPRESAETPTPDEEGEEPSAPSPWNPFATAPTEVPAHQEPPAPRLEPEPPVVLVPPVFPPAMDVPPPVSAEPAAVPPQEEPETTAQSADDSHGLASLLGFFDGAPDEEKPASHSVIGDTTGIVIVPPPIPPAAPSPPASSPADTPTTQLDTAEMAALLRARTDDPQPEEFLSPEPEAPPVVPPLEEAALLMGALPSPATQRLDAESLADATATGANAAVPADDVEDTADERADDTATKPVEADGLASLFGTASAAPTVLFPELAATEAMPSLAGTPSPAVSAASGAPIPTSAIPVPAGPVIPGGPGAPGGAGGSGGPGGPGRSSGLGGSSNANRLLFWVAGGLAVVLVLIGLFALGTRLPSLFGGAAPVPSSSASGASATPTPSPTPTPTVQPKPAAAQPAGTHPWNTLGGGECIDPYTTPWAETFTVVDCAAPHAAQMVYTNLFSADPAAPYPGADALAQQINVLCTKPGVIDLAAAGAYPDLQLQGTYPATEQQWKDGQRSYYCFANRSGGQPLTSSVAGPGPAA
ncbi:septum formation family protein [Leifsonia sp. NPDC058230]|uniref:septum formation family protein n=1 Tax=Leifsonia sp. NPDC058230 TaxID=3346391 RepID=UPI0036DA7A08